MHMCDWGEWQRGRERVNPKRTLLRTSGAVWHSISQP